MALSKDVVDAQIKSVGLFDSFGTKKEIAFLPEIMRESEEILFLTSGFTDGNTWLITATNMRLIFLDKGFIYGLKQIEYPYDKISSISHKLGMLMGKISIGTSSGDVIIDNIAKADVSKMNEIISNHIHNQYTHTTPTAVGSKAPVDDIISKLERLGSMKEKGLLTDEEYVAAKAKLLN